MSRSVLVTGATGFIGRHCLSELTVRGYRVHALARRAGAAQEGVVWHEADLLEPASTADLLRGIRAESLLHLAWYTEHGKFWRSPLNLDWTAASLALVRAFAAAGGRRLVAAGSCAEYDWSHSPASEAQTPTRPDTLYGRCKLSLFETLSAAAPELGLSFAWGRIFFTYGLGDSGRRLVPSVIDSLLRGEPAECTEGRQELDFMLNLDIAAAFAALLDSQVSGPVNIASGECRPVAEVVALIGELTGRPELIRLGARPSRPDDPARLAADLERLHGELCFRPRHSLASGLALTVRERRRLLASQMECS